MTSAIVQDLRRQADSAWSRLGRLLDGMDANLDRADTPGEWTVREVLSHLLGADDPNLLEAPTGYFLESVEHDAVFQREALENGTDIRGRTGRLGL